MPRLLWLGPLSLVYSKYDFKLIDLSEVSDRSLDVPWGAPRPMEAVDHAAVAGLNPRWDIKEIERRLADGQECFLWERGHEIVHLRWMAIDETYLGYLGLRVHAGPRCAISVEAYTPPRFRRTGLFASSIAWCQGWARRQDCTHVVFLVAWWNSLMRTYSSKVGARGCGAMTTLLGARFPSGSVKCRAGGGLEVSVPSARRR